MVMTNIAVEHGHRNSEFPDQHGDFNHSYVKIPEDSFVDEKNWKTWCASPRNSGFHYFHGISWGSNGISEDFIICISH